MLGDRHLAHVGLGHSPDARHQLRFFLAAFFQGGRRSCGELDTVQRGDVVDGPCGFAQGLGRGADAEFCVAANRVDQFRINWRYRNTERVWIGP
ncbi:hypothetical protein D3C86_1732010 [compost metagenome]